MALQQLLLTRQDAHVVTVSEHTHIRPTSFHPPPVEAFPNALGLMISTATSTSAFGRPSTATRGTRRPTSKDGEKQQIWVPMLNNASKGKDLAEKQLLVLGGTPDQQREFLEHLNPPTTRPRYNDRHQDRKAPISNRYSLGYTYQNVLDADQEDVLARLNVYMLSNSSASFVPLLRPLFTAKTVKDTLVTILLDWSDPLKWARQLCQWVRLLRSVVSTLDDDAKVAMEENMNDWKERRVGPNATTAQAGTTDGVEKQKPAQTTPLGAGEWDEVIGVPLSVVCVQSEKIEVLERDLGWQDEHFDFLTQWLRCVLLKHGASLVYTATFDANDVRTLLHSSLSIHSLLKRETAKPNYIERDKILIPPNWDSWGKIRPLREGTDLEAISDAWSVEIQAPPEDDLSFDNTTTSEPDSAVSIYALTLPQSPNTTTTDNTTSPDDMSSPVPSIQEFLSTQSTILDSLKAEDEKEVRSKPSGHPGTRRPATTGINSGTDTPTNTGRMADQIGPYQINVNGIDFDAEEATRRLKEREAERTATAATAAPSSRSTTAVSGTGSGVSTPTRKAGAVGEDGKASNEAMSAFFQNLIKKDRRGGGGSDRGGVSPQRVASPALGK